MLRFCKNCGLLVPHDAHTCPQCGAPVPPPAAPAPGRTAPLYDAPDREDEPAIEAMSQTATTITMILFAIPIVGLVLSLVWSLGGTHDPARKRLARAYLIRTLVVAAAAVLFVLVAALVFSAVLHSQLAYSYYYYR
ncbi:zinc-ribbon domain-containing protein [Gemmiger sp.]